MFFGTPIPVEHVCCMGPAQDDRACLSQRPRACPVPGTFRIPGENQAAFPMAQLRKLGHAQVPRWANLGLLEAQADYSKTAKSQVVAMRLPLLRRFQGAAAGNMPILMGWISTKTKGLLRKFGERIRTGRPTRQEAKRVRHTAPSRNRKDRICCYC